MTQLGAKRDIISDKNASKKLGMLRSRQKRQCFGGTKKMTLQIRVFPRLKHFISFSETMKLRLIVTKAMKITERMVESGTICFTFTHLTSNSFNSAINLVN